MTQNTPLSPGHARATGEARRDVLSAAQLRARGVSASTAAARCRTGGPWQQPLPGVYVLHPDPLGGEELLRSALLYAGRPPASSSRPQPESGYGEAVLTGLAALALHGFATAPPPGSAASIDVLVPRTRRLRSVGYVRLVRSRAVRRAERLRGLPVAPVERALADAVAGLTDPLAVRGLMIEAVRGGHCEPGVLVRELRRARLLERPQVVRAVGSLLAEGRALAEGRLYAMVREHGLPEPLWNVELRLPGGPALGGVDAYWPQQAVAVQLDAAAHQDPVSPHGAAAGARAAEREHLERLGVTVVRLSPAAPRGADRERAIVVRTALMAAADREPAALLTVLPR
ncbi:hypothetical protein ACFVWY_24645 [Streptomyces sp. NPDC058195]|uniref:hypothetical protein n=1 Tax=Streptomyces sp. NPDC058195 TaxID=3346375 RepID=UPI0036EA86AE